MWILLPLRSLLRSSSGIEPTGSEGRSRLAAGSSQNALPPASPVQVRKAASAALRIERQPGQVLLASRTRDHVVLDANAAKVLERGDALPLDHLPDGLAPGFVQELVDEIE